MGNIYVRIYTLRHGVDDILKYTDNLKFVELGASKNEDKGQVKHETLKELEGLKEGDIVFIGIGGTGAIDPKRRELIGIVRIIGEPYRNENEKSVWVKVEAEVLERFFDDEGNKVKEWRDKWPEFESILGRQKSFQRIATEKEEFASIEKKVQEVLNARKFRGED